MFSSIFKSVKFNFYLITGFEIFFILWWLVIHFGLKSSNINANIYWSFGYALVLFMCGAYSAWLVVRIKNVIYFRTAIIFLGLGMVAQAIACTMFSYNSYIANAPFVYPTSADIFFVGAGLLYLLSILWISRLFIKGRLKYFIFWFVCFSVLVGVLVSYFLYANGYNFSPLLTTIFDFGYILTEGPAAIIALSILFTTRFFKTEKYRSALILICIGVICQFFVDLYFVIGTRLGIWAIGEFGDMLYLFAYYPVVAGTILLLSVPVTVELLIFVQNSFLFIQFILSIGTDRFISSMIVLVMSILISVVLLKRNKAEILSREEKTKLEALAESHRQLQELDKQKTEFLTIAAHHLRTPVSIMRNYLAMIKDGDYGAVNSGLVPILANMDTSNQWLVRLADEFVAIASLEQGATKYHISSTNLTELILQIVTELTPRAKEQGLDIRFDHPAEPFTLPLDAEKIRQAFMNLLDNAIKYSEHDVISLRESPATNGAHANITVTIRAEDGGSAVRVMDQGIGFSSADLQNFFQKFRRGNNAKTLHVNTSTGLGLYIARMFVEGHSGKVWAKSEGLGKGSEFGFCLPAKHAGATEPNGSRGGPRGGDPN